jgi:hypothetical protein
VDAVPPSDASWLPAHKDLVTGIVYAARYSWAFVPALIVLPLLFLIARSSRRRFWELLTIVAAASVFPGQVALTMSQGDSWGDPRYFASLTIFATVTLAWAARQATMARRLSLPARRAICLALIGLAALNAVSGTRNDLNPKTTAVEDESVVFRAAFGLPQPKNILAAVPVVEWQRFDSYIDRYLATGQVIMANTDTAFPAPLFSRYPAQWVLPSDTDFQRLAENFSGQFQWLLQSPARPTLEAAELAQALTSTDGGAWQKARYFGATVGQLYRWVPDKDA